MEINEANLKLFSTWLTTRGRVVNTAQVYCSNLRRCQADPAGLTNRLVAGDLAPNTRRTALAALQAWARFTKDADLTESLGELRLPPARRVTSKVPLQFKDWTRLIHHLRSCAVRCEAVRHTMVIMAIRGLRVADVTRIRRSDVGAALKTGRLNYEGKGRKRHDIAAEPLRAELQGLYDLTLPKGKPWAQVGDLISPTPRAATKRVWRSVQRVAAQIDIEGMYPHKFRHTFAVHFLAELKGDPNALVKLQKFMGWASLQTAARYVEEISAGELDTIGAGLMDRLR